jgi:hypothetical protein
MGVTDSMTYLVAHIFLPSSSSCCCQQREWVWVCNVSQWVSVRECVCRSLTFFALSSHSLTQLLSFWAHWLGLQAAGAASSLRHVLIVRFCFWFHHFRFHMCSVFFVFVTEAQSRGDSAPQGTSRSVLTSHSCSLEVWRRRHHFTSNTKPIRAHSVC